MCSATLTDATPDATSLTDRAQEAASVTDTIHHFFGRTSVIFIE